MITIIAILEFAFLCYLYYRYRKVKKIKEKARKAKCKQREKYREYFVHQLELATTLDEIYNIHRLIWSLGIQNPNIGPDKYGMFRTDDISTMTKQQVYLGNIWGLFTQSLSFWETCEDKDSRNIVTKQYKNHLICNI